MFGSNVKTSDSTHALGKYAEALSHVNFQFVFLLHIFFAVGGCFPCSVHSYDLFGDW